MCESESELLVYDDENGKERFLLDEDQLKMQISYTLGGAPYYERSEWTWDDLEN